MPGIDPLQLADTLCDVHSRTTLSPYRYERPESYVAVQVPYAKALRMAMEREDAGVFLRSIQTQLEAAAGMAYRLVSMEARTSPGGMDFEVVGGLVAVGRPGYEFEAL